jgi:hypothetical protein
MQIDEIKEGTIADLLEIVGDEISLQELARSASLRTLRATLKLGEEFRNWGSVRRIIEEEAGRKVKPGIDPPKCRL